MLNSLIHLETLNNSGFHFMELKKSHTLKLSNQTIDLEILYTANHYNLGINF